MNKYHCVSVGRREKDWRHKVPVLFVDKEALSMDVQQYLKDLETLVNMDSFSTYPEGTARVAVWLKERLDRAGWTTELIPVGDAVGPCLKAVWGNPDHYDVILLGHMDTVFPVGTVRERPFSIEGDHYKGPGSADMKCGDLFMVYLAEILAAEKAPGSVCLLFNPDEEISSRYSRPVIEREARKADHALIMESARPNGDLVNERKGICKYTITFEGIASHAGVNPDKGASAINEFIRWGEKLIALADRQAGTTLNIGLVQGGTAANVVAAQCRCVVDVRIKKSSEGERIDRALRELEAHPFDARVKITVDGGVARPPMMPTEKSLEFCRLADRIGAEQGVAFHWQAAGGGSDGNFTSALGIPTLDGLGPVGGNGHGVTEYGEISSLEPRFRFLEALVKAVLTK